MKLNLLNGGGRDPTVGLMQYIKEETDGNNKNYTVTETFRKKIELSKDTSERLQSGMRVIPDDDNGYLILKHYEDEDPPYVLVTSLTIKKST